MRRTSGQNKGFTLVEIMIVVAIIGMLAAIAIPNFVTARASAQANACMNNLRQIDAAKQQWAMEVGRMDTDTPDATDIQPYLGRGLNGTLPYCPIDPSKTFTTSYSIGMVRTSPTCINGGSGSGGSVTNHVLQAR